MTKQIKQGTCQSKTAYLQQNNSILLKLLISVMCIPIIHVTQNNSESGVNAVVTLWFSLFFREAPLDRKHAGCPRRRLRVEKSFIREQEVIPSIQKKTPPSLPFPSVIQLKRHNYLFQSCMHMWDWKNNKHQMLKYPLTDLTSE